MKSATIEKIEILTACFILYFLYGGASRLVAIFFVESIQQYGINRKQASFPYVLAFMLRNISGPLLGYLEQIFGIKVLVIFGNIVTTVSIGACFFAKNILTITILWGIIFGFCFGLATQYLPSLINAHFTTHRSKANGFTYSGACIGGVVLPPIIDTCVECYGLNGSFLILAGIMAHSIPFSFLLKSQKEKSKTILLRLKDGKRQGCCEAKENEVKDLQTIKDKDSNKKIRTDLNSAMSIETNSLSTKRQTSDSSVQKNTSLIFNLQNFTIFIDLAFINMLFMSAGNTFVTTTMWTIILDYVRDKGVGVNLEIYYVMIISFADIFGRLASGFFIDKKFLPNAVLTSILCVATGLTLLGLLLVYHYLLVMLFVFLFPIFYGSVMILQIALIHEFIPPEKSVMAMASRQMLYAPLNLAISPMIGYFRGQRGSYDGVTYILIGISFFCGFIVYFVPHLAKRRQNT